MKDCCSRYGGIAGIKVLRQDDKHESAYMTAQVHSSFVKFCPECGESLKPDEYEIDAHKCADMPSNLRKKPRQLKPEKRKERCPCGEDDCKPEPVQLPPVTQCGAGSPLRDTVNQIIRYLHYLRARE